ncbi:MAG: class I fructose-bisphosphate aldolase [Gammaproteobacteria bacterium]
MSTTAELEATISDLVAKDEGILAADESLPTIEKRFAPIDVESTAENRRVYRSLLLSTPDLGEFISGVILFEETLGQEDDKGTPLPEVAKKAGIVPGVKVDKGTVALANAPGDKITEGLDGLAARLTRYKEQGARFAKWRNVYRIDPPYNPHRLAVDANAEVLARYAAICQQQGIVPIVEPEVLMDGEHSIDRCAVVTETVQHAVFHALHRHGVSFEHMLLKPNMVMPGAKGWKADPETVAEHTLKVLRRTVPSVVPSINFLSGGQSPEEATANLNAMNELSGQAPWELSFSYGRALQEPALKAWRGNKENIEFAQRALYERAKLNGAARIGGYSPSMEKAA